MIHEAASTSWSDSSQQVDSPWPCLQYLQQLTICLLFALLYQEQGQYNKITAAYWIHRE